MVTGNRAHRPDRLFWHTIVSPIAYLRDATDILRHRNPARRGSPTSPDGMKRVLLVGAGSGGQVLMRELRDNPRWKLWPVAFVDDDRRKIGRMIDGVPVLGDTGAIMALVQSHAIDVVVIAIPSAAESDRSEWVRSAEQTSAKVLTMPAIGSILRGGASVTTLTSVRSVDVLGRPAIAPDLDSCLQFIRGKRVLVTGAAGSIGEELSRQIAELEPSRLILLDTNETGLHDLSLEIKRWWNTVDVHTFIASVTDPRRIQRIFQQYRPEIVLHAAAYKHVPAMESQPDQAIETNVIGTDIVVRHAAAFGAERFVLVSTDKAVRPSSVMGATKRLAELAVAAVGKETDLSVCNVRFGNVLGSRGSVIPTFERQIRAGGPVTITDARMKRYFMTIPEAVSLIIQAGAFGHRNVTYILDMGEPVSIVDLAKRVIELHGLRPDEDIRIVYTGVRPGEKLYEELTLDFEAAHETLHPKVRLVDGVGSRLALKDVPARLAKLVYLINTDASALKRSIHELIVEVDGSSPAFDAVQGELPLKLVHRAETTGLSRIRTISSMAQHIPDSRGKRA